MGATLVARYPGIGGEDQHLIAFVGDTSYPTGGYIVNAASFSFNAFAPDGLGTGLPPTVGAYWIVGQTNTGTTGNYDIQLNPVNGRLQFFVSSTGAEVANGVDVSAQGAILAAYGH